MGGDVNVESQEGIGTKFIITQQIKAIDLIVLVNDVNKMTETEKIDYLQRINAFDFTSNFYTKFNTINEQNLIGDEHEDSFNTLGLDINLINRDNKELQIQSK